MLKLLIILPLLFFPQEDWTPFQKLYENDGFEVKFLFFSEGNGVKDNGVSLLLKNAKDFPRSYGFTLIFRAGKVDKKIDVKGNINAGQKKTGSNDGLYWIPFEDKRTITHVGITKIRLKKIADEPE